MDYWIRTLPRPVLYQMHNNDQLTPYFIEEGKFIICAQRGERDFIVGSYIPFDNDLSLVEVYAIENAMQFNLPIEPSIVDQITARLGSYEKFEEKLQTKFPRYRLPILFKDIHDLYGFLEGFHQRKIDITGALNICLIDAQSRPELREDGIPEAISAISIPHRIWSVELVQKLQDNPSQRN